MNQVGLGNNSATFTVDIKRGPPSSTRVHHAERERVAMIALGWLYWLIYQAASLAVTLISVPVVAVHALSGAWGGWESYLYAFPATCGRGRRLAHRLVPAMKRTASAAGRASTRSRGPRSSGARGATRRTGCG